MITVITIMTAIAMIFIPINVLTTILLIMTTSIN